MYLTIAGPGTTNLVTELYDVKMDRALVLVLTGRVAFQLLGLGSFQEIDQHVLFEAIADFNEALIHLTKPRRGWSEVEENSVAGA